MYIDTHCHLEKAFYNNIDNVILECRCIKNYSIWL